MAALKLKSRREAAIGVLLLGMATYTNALLAPPPSHHPNWVGEPNFYSIMNFLACELAFFWLILVGMIFWCPSATGRVSAVALLASFTFIVFNSLLSGEGLGGGFAPISVPITAGFALIIGYAIGKAVESAMKPKRP